jgi:outer membrane protein TolC
LIGYARVVLGAFAEVEDQLSTLTQTRQQAVALEAQRVAVQAALRIARNRHHEGYSTYLEELDAQRTLFNVEQTAVQLRADLLVAHVNLYRALGGGWKPNP